MLTELSLNFTLTATNIIGLICLIAGALLSFFAKKVYTFFNRNSEPTTDNINMIKIIALALAVFGAILIINF